MRLIIVYLFGIMNLILGIAILFSISNDLKDLKNIPSLLEKALTVIISVAPPLTFALRSLIWKYRQSKTLWITTFVFQILGLVSSVLYTVTDHRSLAYFPVIFQVTIFLFLNLIILLWHMPETEGKQPEALSNSEGEKNQ